MDFIVFAVLSAAAIVAGLATIAWKNPIRSALSLIICLFALAGVYVTLYAHFIAAMQVLVYAGAIMVLFVFVIMLLNLQEGKLAEAKVTIVSVLSGVVVLLLVGKFYRVLSTFGSNGGPMVPGKGIGPEFGTVSPIGEMLFKQFLLPFELVSVLLLIAVVGAVVIARRRFWREGE